MFVVDKGIHIQSHGSLHSDRYCITHLLNMIRAHFLQSTYVRTSFCAARACSTSAISRLFSSSRVAGVRWSSSRSGIFLKNKQINDWLLHWPISKLDGLISDLDWFFKCDKRAQYYVNPKCIVASLLYILYICYSTIESLSGIEWKYDYMSHDWSGFSQQDLE